MRSVAFALATALAAWASSHASAPPAGMVQIAAATYEPLFRSEGPKPVAAFFLDVAPVTNAEFLEFVRANAKWQRSKVAPIFADARYLEHWSGDLELGPRDKVLPEGPVTNVSWFAARAYARWKNKRLPTLAEWEVAAAAGRNVPRGADEPGYYQRILEWYARPTILPLPSVGDVPADFNGVRALHGLVWEWVEDFNTAMVTGESRADVGLERDLFCGSGAAGAAEFRDYAAFLRSAFRSSLDAKYAVANLGFRCAANAQNAR